MYTAGPSGVVTVPCLSNPLSRSIDRSQVARRRVRLDLGDLGIIEQQLNQGARTEAGSQTFAHADAFASDFFRVLLDRFLLPPSVPLPRATYDWAYPIGSPFSITMYGVTDSCAKRTCKYCSCTSASVGRASSAPPLDDMRSI